MNRLYLTLAIVLLARTAPADDGRSVSATRWPASDSGLIAQATPPTPPRAPVAPVAPVAPTAKPVPPAPPVPPHRGSGVSFSMHDGKVQIDGLKDMVTEQLARAEATIKNTNMPPEVRDKLEKRMARVREKIEKRMAHLDAADVDQLGEELGKMGDEIGQEMDDFGKDMDAWGQNFGNQMAKQFGKGFGPNIHITRDDNDDDDDKLASVPDIDDQDDLDDAVSGLGDLSLKPPQREAIQKLRADSDKQVAAGKQALEQASAALKKQLDNVAANDADIAKAIDAVTQQEAVIRKARILAWHDARRVLDEAQRKKVQDAAKAKTK